MDLNKTVTTRTLCTAEAIIASGSWTSDAIDIKYTNGTYSIYLELTGDGTAKVEYLLSNDGGTTYIDPVSGTDIVTGFTKTSGTGSDGKDILGFDTEVSPSVKIKITETGGVNPVTVKCILAAQ